MAKYNFEFKMKIIRKYLDGEGGYVYLANNYGCLRMTKELKDRGFHVNKKKVQRLIKKLGIEVKSYTRKLRRYSSYRGKVGTVAKNRIHRRFYISIYHQKITTDTTEFKYFEADINGVICQKKLYLDPFMDLYNSEILSNRVSEKPNALAVMEGLEEAIQVTNDCPFCRTFHSDQGWAYQMKAYSYKLKENKIFHGEVYRSFDELKTAINDYIYYYNNKRMKKKLNWQSPVKFRNKAQSVA